MTTFVAVFIDKSGFHREISFEENESYKFSNFCSVFYKILKDKDFEIEPDDEIKQVEISIFKCVVKNGKIARKPLGKYHHYFPVRRLTSSEYEVKLNAILNEIPNSFNSFVRNQSWERGHSAGYEEVLMIAKEIVGELSPAVQAYRQFLLSIEQI